MTSPNDPAFPGSQMGPTDPDVLGSWRALSKREYFAVMALQGLLAGSGGETSWHETNFAVGAINLADALIAELNKGVK